MPQFDFYIFNNFTIFFAAAAVFLVFITLFLTALSVWVRALSRLSAKVYLMNKTLALARAAQLPILCNDLLEQFILADWRAAAPLLGAGFLLFFAAAFAARQVAAFVGSVGADVYAEGAIKFSRSWNNFSVIFLCILLANLLGILPFSFTITSSLAAPFCFSLTMFFVCVYTAGLRGGLSAAAGFLPAGTERTVAPLIILIETVSNLAKFVSLGIRLFANMFAGHLLLKVFYSICFQLSTAISFFFIWSEAAVFTFVLLIIGLEIMIAVLQAFVFVLLSILYLKEAENFILPH